MKAAIFAEGSRTTTEDYENQTVTDYFQGLFLPVSVLEKELSRYVSTDVHILSERYGYVLGDTPASELSEGNVDDSEPTERFADAIVEAAGNTEIILILLSASTFEETVEPRWDEILSQIHGDSIVCIGASRSALHSIDVSELKSRADTVLIYERAGVAPIGEETREQLMQRVREQCGEEGK